jgi:hypothetical protein
VAVNDPHVEELIYHIDAGDRLNFRDPPPVKDETNAFRMILNDGVVAFSMKEHHPTEESARRAVEGYLRAWELDVALQYDSLELRFVFDRPKIIDRNPPPPSPPGMPHTVALEAIASLRSASASGTRVVFRRQYPRPPRDFVADTDTTTMREQYERYKQGRDRLLPMAYSCLARLEHRARNHSARGNKRMKSASMYRVDYEVLDKLGELTNTLGDEVEARKLTSQSQLRAPTAQEVKWIEAATAMAVTSLRHASLLGKILTTLVALRFIS